MYIPPSFATNNYDEIFDFVKAHPFGILVSSDDKKPAATHIPFVLQRAGDDTCVLKSHFAKANPQNTLEDGQEVMVIFHGPHAYISPSLYDHPVNVPTWNYIAVHVYGRIRFIKEENEVKAHLEELIDYLEPAYKNQWETLPEKYISALMGELSSFRVESTDIQAVFKLNQNKSAESRRNIVGHLSASGDSMESETGEYMAKRLKPDQEK